MFEIVYSLNVKDNYIFPCLHTIRLFYYIKKMLQYFCQSDCACLHQTVNMVVFLAKRLTKIPTLKGEHSCKCSELSFKRKEGIDEVHVFVCQNLYI